MRSVAKDEIVWENTLAPIKPWKYIAPVLGKKNNEIPAVCHAKRILWEVSSDIVLCCCLETKSSTNKLAKP